MRKEAEDGEKRNGQERQSSQNGDRRNPPSGHLGFRLPASGKEINFCHFKPPSVDTL
jgi:hypothetical protein